MSQMVTIILSKEAIWVMRQAQRLYAVHRAVSGWPCSRKCEPAGLLPSLLGQAYAPMFNLDFSHFLVVPRIPLALTLSL